MTTKFKDISGQAFGWLIALKYMGGDQCSWLCVCKCGKRIVTQGGSLRNGSSQSCGCKRVVLSKELWKNPLYQRWANIKDRCLNPKSKDYPRYGGRGITISKEWIDSPYAFITWSVCNGWQKGLQIDRIDNDGPYSPNNCRYTTAKVNSNNRRKRNACRNS